MPRYDGHSIDAYVWRAELGIPNPEPTVRTTTPTFQVIHENGDRSDIMFNLDDAIWEAVEHSLPGKDVRIEDEKEYTVWTITEGIIT
jgi:hypothetical protein